MEYRELIAAAKNARNNAYAKYSDYPVGCALLCDSGKVYLGANMENSSYPAGICAERAAFSAAITAGERKFTAIAVVGGDGDITPCGICRQTMSEFCETNFIIVTEKKKYFLTELLPEAFKL